MPKTSEPDIPKTPSAAQQLGKAFAKSAAMAVRPPFPLSKPNWPNGVARPEEVSRLGVNYDTEWSRSYPARIVRAAFLDWLSKPVARAIAPATVLGEDRLAGLDFATNPVILAPNHASHVDTLVLLTSLPEQLRHRTIVAAAADYFFDTRVKSALWALTTAAIPIERNKVNRRSAQVAADLLNEGWSLLIYPEGGRTPDGWIQKFSGGAAYLSLKTGTPVVPIYLKGTRSVMAKGSSKIRQSPTTVIFGNPMPPAAHEDARKFASAIEDEVAKLADEAENDWWSATLRAAKGTTPSLAGPDAPAWRRTWELGRSAK